MNKKIAMFALTGCLAMTIAAGHSDAAGDTTTATHDTGNGVYTNQRYNGTVNNGLGTTGFNTYSTDRYANNNNGTYRARALANDDNDFDWGWLGLLGLIGLAGMRSRNRERDRA